MKPWITIANTWATMNTATTVPINRLAFMQGLKGRTVQETRGREAHALPAPQSPSAAWPARPLFLYRHHRRIGIDITGTDFPRRVLGQRLRRGREHVQDLIGLECPARRFLHQRDDSGDVRRRH